MTTPASTPPAAATAARTSGGSAAPTAPPATGGSSATARARVPPTAPAGRWPADTLTALTTALAAENAASWAYGLVAAYDVADAADIAGIQSGHLARRDATAALIISGGGKAATPAPAYVLPNPVTDRVSALAAATLIETDCAAAWRAVIGATDNAELRGVAIAGLSDSAVWLATLKMDARKSPPTVPFPGKS